MGAIVLIVLAILCLIAGTLLFIFRDKSDDPDTQDIMKVSSIVGWAAAGVFTLLISTCGFTIVDAGEVGVQVIFGKVVETPLLSGFNAKNIFSDVYKYSIRLNEYTMSISPNEGKKQGDDSVVVRTADNSEVKIDCTVWWRTDPNKVFYIYQNVAQSQEALESLVIRPASRSAMQSAASIYTLTTLMDQKSGFAALITDNVSASTKDKGVIVDRILIRSIIPPSEIDDAIKAKLAAQQQLEQKQFDLEKTKKDAEIRIVEAEGIAKAQSIIQLNLSPIYVQYEAIKAYERLAGSPNTTFVIMPTSPNAAGMPLILDTKR